MRTADSADQRMRCADARCNRQRISPGAGRIYDPMPGNREFVSAPLVLQEDAADAPIAQVNLQHARVIARSRSRLQRFDEPLRNQALREFALRVIVGEQRPPAALIEQGLEAVNVFAIRSAASWPRPYHLSVQPKPRSEGERTPLLSRTKRQNKFQ